VLQSSTESATPSLNASAHHFSVTCFPHRPPWRAPPWPEGALTTAVPGEQRTTIPSSLPLGQNPEALHCPDRAPTTLSGLPSSVGVGVLPLHESGPVMWLPSMTVGPPTLLVTETAPVTVLPPRATGTVFWLNVMAPVRAFAAQVALS